MRIKKILIIFAVIVAFISIYLIMGVISSEDDGVCNIATAENRKADVNSDGEINVLDLVLVSQYFTEEEPFAEYDSTYDMDCDNDVDQTDMGIVGMFYD